MKNMIKGKAFVLGDDIDTDQIIPAEHLVYSLDDENEQKQYGRFALSGVPAVYSGLPQGNIPFVKQGEFQSEFQIIVAGKNFGCGSSREHAPFALKMAGVKGVVAGSYARIFYRNAVDGGFLIPLESEDDLSPQIKTGDVIEINPDDNILTNKSTGKQFLLKPLGEVAAIVAAGGIFEYARINQMV